MTAADSTREAAELREQVRARIEAYVMGTFRVSYEQEPHPDEVALVDRLTDAVLPLEEERRAVLARSAELEAENARMREELKQLRAGRTFLDGQVFVSGWYAHAEACASLGWDARESAWRKYREEMTATLVKAEPAPQQPEPERFADECDCECQPGQPCMCPERDCHCGPCPACGEAPQQRDTADGGADRG